MHPRDSPLKDDCTRDTFDSCTLRSHRNLALHMVTW